MWTDGGKGSQLSPGAGERSDAWDGGLDRAQQRGLSAPWQSDVSRARWGGSNSWGEPRQVLSRPAPAKPQTCIGTSHLRACLIQSLADWKLSVYLPYSIFLWAWKQSSPRQPSPLSSYQSVQAAALPPWAHGANPIYSAHQFNSFKYSHRWDGCSWKH